MWGEGEQHAKQYVTADPPPPLLRWGDGNGETERQEGEAGAIGKDRICQPNEDNTNNLNVSSWLRCNEMCLEQRGSGFIAFNKRQGDARG